MIRMIQEQDIFTCWWWYNWYITHSECTFETEPLDGKVFSDRVHKVRENYPWIVLEEDDQLIGYAYLNSFNTRAAYDWTADVSIYLNPELLGQGYGKRLFDALIDIAEKDGYRSLISIITETNTGSIKIHEQMGFKRQGEVEKSGYKNGQWLGVVYYQKMLKDVNDDEQLEHPLNLDPYLETKPGRVPVTD